MTEQQQMDRLKRVTLYSFLLLLRRLKASQIARVVFLRNATVLLNRLYVRSSALGGNRLYPALQDTQAARERVAFNAKYLEGFAQEVEAGEYAGRAEGGKSYRQMKSR